MSGRQISHQKGMIPVRSAGAGLPQLDLLKTSNTFWPFCKLSSFFSFSFSFWHGSIQSKVLVWLTVSHLMVGIFCQKKKQQKQFKQLSKNWIYWSHVPRCFPYNSNVRIGSNLIDEWIFFGKHSSGPLILLIISYNIQS